MSSSKWAGSSLEEEVEAERSKGRKAGVEWKEIQWTKCKETHEAWFKVIQDKDGALHGLMAKPFPCNIYSLISPHSYHYACY